MLRVHIISRHVWARLRRVSTASHRAAAASREDEHLVQPHEPFAHPAHEHYAFPLHGRPLDPAMPPHRDDVIEAMDFRRSDEPLRYTLDLTYHEQGHPSAEARDLRAHHDITGRAAEVHESARGHFPVHPGPEPHHAKHGHHKHAYKISEHSPPEPHGVYVSHSHEVDHERGTGVSGASHDGHGAGRGGDKVRH